MGERSFDDRWGLKILVGLLLVGLSFWGGWAIGRSAGWSAGYGAGYAAAPTPPVPPCTATIAADGGQPAASVTVTTAGTVTVRWEVRCSKPFNVVELAASHPVDGMLTVIALREEAPNVYANEATVTTELLPEVLNFIPMGDGLPVGEPVTLITKQPA